MAVSSRVRIWFSNAVLVCASAAIGYVATEVAWRVYLHDKLADGVSAQIMSHLRTDGPDGTLSGASVFDARTGHRYLPNISVEHSDPFPVSWRTNRHGHVADSEYDLSPARDEFRIGLVGDSFTANVTNSIRWGDVLQRKLNDSPFWRGAVGEKRTIVINFGLDGIGLVQFDDVVEELVLPFSIDLLLVNVIRNDVLRRPYYRGQKPPDSEDALRAYVAENILASVPWYIVYPEVLVIAVGRWTGLQSRLRPKIEEALRGERFYNDVDQAVKVGRDAIGTIRHHFPDAIFLVHPEIGDLRGIPDELDKHAFEKLADATPEAKWIDMSDRWPRPWSEANIRSWFNLPHDHHNSDRGLEVYGGIVAELLIERFRDRRVSECAKPAECSQPRQ